MLARIDLRGMTPSAAELRHVLPRGGVDVDAVLGTVAPVVEDVRTGGATAALSYGEKFDGVVPATVRVPEEVISDAVQTLDADVLDALQESIRRVRIFHAAQKPQDHSCEIVPGGVVSERWVPVERVGLYVPGGKAVYPSSVIMNVVPAQEAGVSSLVVASPPQESGWPHPTILAACQLLGVEEIWAVGGAQAVALLAYGCAESDLQPVDMITGPGNIFVTAAKRLVRGVVGIDSEAGPTEIAVLADESADAVEIAYDLISQAEHDPMAASVLITTSEQLADNVEREVAQRYSVTLNADRVKEALEGKQSGIVLVDTIDAAVAAANSYAAEHLEIHTADAEAVAARITNAGAIFIGRYSPVPLGDYSAGSNHVLPTSGSARHSSGLSTHTFLKSIHVVNYNEDALRGVAATVQTLAAAERLPAHGEAIAARFNECPVGAADSTGRGANSAAEEQEWTMNNPSQTTDSKTITLADLPLREELRGHSAYGAPQLTVANQLNTNENPYAPSDAIIEQIARRVKELGQSLNRYPDRDATELRRELAGYVSRRTGVEVTEANVWAANGSNEVLQQLLQAFGGPGRKAMGFTPSYSMHPILSAGTQTEFVAVARDEQEHFAISLPRALAEVKAHQPEVIFLTTPNNPTGNITPLDEIRAIIDAAPGIVIVDEAYAEFSDEPSAVTLLAEYPTKLVVSRTMSKAFDFAGGRLGYFVADPAFVEAVMLVRLPYHLSTLSQAAAMAALEHSEDTLATVDTLRAERDRVVTGLRAQGFTVVDSRSNFVFFGHFDDAHAAWEQFLDRDVLIRDVGVPGWLRATVGLPAENDAFLAAAAEVATAQLSQ